MLYDIDVCDGEVGHQHVDQSYYATVPSRDISPARGDVSADAWERYSPDDLRESDLPEDNVRFGLEASRAASQS